MTVLLAGLVVLVLVGFGVVLRKLNVVHEAVGEQGRSLLLTRLRIEKFVTMLTQEELAVVAPAVKDLDAESVALQGAASSATPTSTPMKTRVASLLVLAALALSACARPPSIADRLARVPTKPYAVCVATPAADDVVVFDCNDGMFRRCPVTGSCTSEPLPANWPGSGSAWR